MANTNDSLEIQIKAQATTANNALQKLTGYLDTLDQSLSRLNGSSLMNLASGVSSLSNAMNNLNNSGVKTQDFTRLKTNLEKLATLGEATMSNSASSIYRIANAIEKLGNASTAAENIRNVINALGRLGGVSFEKAIVNIPTLTTALQKMIQTLSKAPSVNRNLIDMTNAMANLASQGQRVGTASRTLNSGLTTYNRVASSSSSKTLSLARAFGKFYASYFLVIRGIKGLWKSIESSMDYVETFNYFNVSMKKIGKDTAARYGEFGQESADAYAEGFKKQMNTLTEKMTGYAVGEKGELTFLSDKNLGLDPEVLMNFEARLGAVTNSVGLLGDASVSTQKALTMLSADLSSLTNTDLSTVMTNLSSGLIGQSRALYKYGIDITNTTLAEYALKLGIEKKVSAMTQAEKMQLRMIAILDQSKVAWGDQANTLNSVANQYRVMKQQAANLARVLGNLFLPIVQRVLPFINGMIMALSRLFEMFGFKLYGDNWLKDTMDGISGGGGEVEDIADGVGDLDDNMEDASKSAQKLKKQLQGFDELNVLSTDDANATTASKLKSFDLSGVIGDALAEYESVWDEAFGKLESKASAFADKIDKVLEPVKKLFNDLFSGNFFGAGQDLSNIVIGIFDWIRNAIKSVDWEQVGRDIGDFLRGIDWEGIMDSIGHAAYEALKAALELWLGSLKSAPLETLTITIASIAFMLGSSRLTSALFGKKLAEATGLKMLSSTLGTLGFTFTVGLAYQWLITESINDRDNPLRKSLNSMYEDAVNTGKMTMEEFDKMMDYLDNLDFSSCFADNFRKVNENWAKFFEGLKDVAINAIDAVKWAFSNMTTSVNLDKLRDYGGGGGRRNAYANGGFVTSDVFFANENGVPELVGTVGGRTAVASGTEITGISNAVYDTGATQASLLSTAVGLLQVIASNGNGVSDDYIFNSFRRSATEYTNRTGNPAIPF